MKLQCSLNENRYVNEYIAKLSIVSNGEAKCRTNYFYATEFPNLQSLSRLCQSAAADWQLDWISHAIPLRERDVIMSRQLSNNLN